ncbi:hypothetical protein DFR76_11661 [Nocardia pseudobrasiliensis]|uniref:Transport and Golgi organization protein 2 n=2 Tax=Nocardia pseudobrasiliensis TaxID=45979 RepID=A0A370HP69_9NOCA|nr:hypothetical protein DFR76_11661 [Nocardia pseudobrasiliensis]
MCTCMFLLDEKAGRFIAAESREHSPYRPHGFDAARKLGLHPRYSYGPHWHDNSGLAERARTIPAPDRAALADVFGGIDAEGGAWLAFNSRTGVYCKLFESDYGTVDSITHELPIACAVHESSRAAADFAAEILGRDDAAVPPSRMLIADGREMFVLARDEAGAVTTTPLAAGAPHVLSTAGDGLAERLAQRATTVPAPTGELYSWGPWLSAYTDPGADGPEYHDKAWTAFSTSAVQPPFVTAGDDLHRNASLFPPANPENVAWTKSVTIYSTGPGGVELFAYNERQLFPDQPVPSEVTRMGFPAAPDDFFVALAHAEQMRGR